MDPKPQQWRVGVIGAGKHGSRYARHIQADVKGLTLTAISRRSDAGSQLATQLGCRWYAQWQDLVAAPEVDCIVAALPPTLNLDVARACAEASKPLLLEKPMAVSVEAAMAIFDLFCARKIPLTIGQTLRYNTIIKALKQELPSIGSLYSVTANQRLEPATLAWLDQPEQAGAGVSYHSAVHIFDALHFITGKRILRVMARSRCLHSTRLEDHLVALVELEGGILGTVDCSKIGPARSGRFELIGSQGQLHGDQVLHLLESVQGAQRTTLDCPDAVSTLVPLLSDWCRFLRGEGDNPIPAEAGLAAVKVAAACLRSATKGGWQEV